MFISSFIGSAESFMRGGYCGMVADGILVIAIGIGVLVIGDVSICSDNVSGTGLAWGLNVSSALLYICITSGERSMIGWRMSVVCCI